MNNPLAGKSKTNLISYLLFIVSGVILLSSFYFTWNVHVLSHWRLILPHQTIHAGDTVVLQSVYTKQRAVTGSASRYIDCDNPAGASVRYPINQAIANRSPGKATGTGIVIVVPSDIPNLPAHCRFSIVIDYHVYPWRTVTEFNSTPDFELLPPQLGAPQ